ncbi:MAG: hypothetical protein IKQ92_08170 [Clostridia bacterium]|nr:hypothetical protein [Clostridia bacterium]
MIKRTHTPRLIALAAVCIAVAFIYTGRLLYLQVSGQDYYSMSTRAVYRTRTEVIQARRGEIFDRNGTPLVVNADTYDLELDYQTAPSSNDEINELLLELRAIAVRCGEENALVEPKASVEPLVRSDGVSVRSPIGFAETARGRRYRRFITELNVAEGASGDEEARAMMLYFGILKTEKDAVTNTTSTLYQYPYSTAAELLLIRLDMVLSEFSAMEPYSVVKGASLSFVSAVEELYSRGFTVKASAERVYCYPGYLSHILGRVGKIQGDIKTYTERGYSYDAVVGLDGCEAVFEDYLRGQNGTRTVTEDAYGNIVDSEITKEPVAGHDIYLTIDIGMQITAENGLAENIFRIRREANPYKPLTGEDASCGALTALDVRTGEILAIGSYPTYNLATFSRDFATLNSDENSPMLNRAINSAYAPGSTFKVGVATAALMEKTITKDTVIDAQGIYMYYADLGYTPRCWLYLLTGQVHGPIKVVEAIQESCNYFFFDVGRQLTIEKMNEYCAHYGLGQPTGIELPEKTGILAGPDYRSDNGLLQWGPGDTLQAAIGQSDNLFTPLQLGCYISTILNHGTRYGAHLLKEVRDYTTGEIVYQSEKTVIDRITIPDEIVGIVKEGMKGVMDNGSAASVFAGYDIPVGGKTGTAQVYSNKSDNGVMTAFAPFDNPEIVVTCIIEQASGGTEAGYSVRDVFDYYFDVEALRAEAERQRLAEEEEKRAQEAAAAAAAAAAGSTGEVPAYTGYTYTDYTAYADSTGYAAPQDVAAGWGG